MKSRVSRRSRSIVCMQAYTLAISKKVIALILSYRLNCITLMTLTCRQNCSCRDTTWPRWWTFGLLSFRSSESAELCYVGDGIFSHQRPSSESICAVTGSTWYIQARPSSSLWLPLHSSTVARMSYLYYSAKHIAILGVLHPSIRLSIYVYNAYCRHNIANVGLRAVE